MAGMFHDGNPVYRMYVALRQFHIWQVCCIMGILQMSGMLHYGNLANGGELHCGNRANGRYAILWESCKWEVSCTVGILQMAGMLYCGNRANGRSGVL